MMTEWLTPAIAAGDDFKGEFPALVLTSTGEAGERLMMRGSGVADQKTILNSVPLSLFNSIVPLICRTRSLTI